MGARALRAGISPREQKHVLLDKDNTPFFAGKK